MARSDPLADDAIIAAAQAGIVSAAALAEHFGLELSQPTEMELAEVGFFAQMDAAPNDDTVRLIFADWLEDRGRANEAAAYRVLANGQIRPYGLTWSSFSISAEDRSILPWRWRFGAPDVQHDNGDVAWKCAIDRAANQEYSRRAAYETAARLYPGNDDPVILYGPAAGYMGQFRRERGFTPEQMPTLNEVSVRYLQAVAAGADRRPFELSPRFNLVAMDMGGKPGNRADAAAPHAVPLENECKPS